MIVLFVESCMYGVNIEDIWEETNVEDLRPCLVGIVTVWSLPREWVDLLNVVPQAFI